MKHHTTHIAAWGDLAAVLANDPATVAKLLANHSATEDGMCRTCTDGGTGRHLTPAPCAIRQVADLATSQIAVREPQ